MQINSQESFVTPQIDVVIPLYNKQDSIGAALRSVLNQTLQPSRIIVVDDGSTDQGPRVVRSIVDGRIELVEQANKGVSSARNTGIQHSTAPIIAFLDADDEWMHDHLDTIARLGQKFPSCDVFATGYVVRTGDGANRMPAIRWPWADDALLEGYFALAARSDPPLFSSAVAVTAAAMKSIRGFPVGIAQGEDLLTWARLAAKYRIAVCGRVSVAYCQPQFASGRPTRRPEKEDRVAPQLEKLLAEVAIPERRHLRRYVALWHKMRGSVYLALGERSPARSEFRRALRYDPMSARLWVKSLLTLIPTSQVQRILKLWIARTRKPVSIPSGPSTARP